MLKASIFLADCLRVPCTPKGLALQALAALGSWLIQFRSQTSQREQDLRLVAGWFHFQGDWKAFREAHLAQKDGVLSLQSL